MSVSCGIINISQLTDFLFIHKNPQAKYAQGMMQILLKFYNIVFKYEKISFSFPEIARNPSVNTVT